MAWVGLGSFHVGLVISRGSLWPGFYRRGVFKLPGCFGCCPFRGGSSVVCCCSHCACFCVFSLVLGALFWLAEVALLYVVAICVPSSRCRVSHAVVAFPGHTHLLFEVWRGIRYNIAHISLLFLTFHETIRPAYAIYGNYI